MQGDDSILGLVDVQPTFMPGGELAVADGEAVVPVINRLRLGMRLQADSTVVYAASGGSGVLDHPLTRRELDADDPYNTYRVQGLPPGPICAPGIASLQAVLHPAPSDDLYFVANGSGGHSFARTLAQHDANVKRWRGVDLR